VYEVDRQKARSLGVNYKIVGDQFALALSHVPEAVGNNLVSSMGVAGAVIRGKPAEVSGATGGNVVGALVSDSLALLAAIDVLQQRAVARSVAEPNVLTLTGEEASVVVGGEVPIPTTAVGQVAAVQGFSFQTFGVRLAIRPTVSDSGIVTMEVAPSIVRPVPGLGNKDVPGFEVQTVQTTARVKAGESLLIGGLLNFVETEEERGIPILSRIPVLGHLFKWKKKIREEKELLFVMTPRLVDEEGLKEDIVLPPLESRDHTLDTQLVPQKLENNGVPQTWKNPEPVYPPDPCPDCPPAKPAVIPPAEKATEAPAEVKEAAPVEPAPVPESPSEAAPTLPDPAPSPEPEPVKEEKPEGSAATSVEQSVIAPEPAKKPSKPLHLFPVLLPSSEPVANKN
jgi:Flp pilus assembly secretin CpaC